MLDKAISLSDRCFCLCCRVQVCCRTRERLRTPRKCLETEGLKWPRLPNDNECFHLLPVGGGCCVRNYELWFGTRRAAAQDSQASFILPQKREAVSCQWKLPNGTKRFPNADIV